MSDCNCQKTTTPKEYDRYLKTAYESIHLSTPSISNLKIRKQRTKQKRMKTAYESIHLSTPSLISNLKIRKQRTKQKRMSITDVRVNATPAEEIKREDKL